MIKEIVTKYEEATNSKVKDSLTPGAPGKSLKRNSDTKKILNETSYRSIMGKVLYYVNKMDMTCANAARELSQHLSSPDQEHWKALGKIVGYLKGRIGKGTAYRVRYRFSRRGSATSYCNVHTSSNELVSSCTSGTRVPPIPRCTLQLSWLTNLSFSTTTSPRNLGRKTRRSLP